jgi:FkbM family methyltransferase
MYFSNPVHILHIGANDGQEIEDYIIRYSSTLKSVTFIECIPGVYAKLCRRLDDLKKRTGTQIEMIPVLALLSDTKNQLVNFYLASNQGGSSSMLEPNPSEWVWDWVNFPAVTQLTTTTADALNEIGILSKEYDALVLDTQGSELKVLNGMTTLLPSVREIITEYSRKEFYKGGVLLPELVHYLMERGFEIDELPPADHADMKLIRVNSKTS